MHECIWKDFQNYYVKSMSMSSNMNSTGHDVRESLMTNSSHLAVVGIYKI